MANNDCLQLCTHTLFLQVWVGHVSQYSITWGNVLHLQILHSKVAALYQHSLPALAFNHANGHTVCFIFIIQCSSLIHIINIIFFHIGNNDNFYIWLFYWFFHQMDDIDAMFSAMLGEMDLLTQVTYQPLFAYICLYILILFLLLYSTKYP